MKKKFIMFSALVLILSCSPEARNNNNPYIPNYSVNLDVNLSLPQYANLKFVSNSVYIPNQGARGIIVFNNSGTTYLAFDAACPNQALSDCSTMTLKGGTSAVCACDNATYSLFNGQSPGKQYPLKQYRVSVNGNLLKVFN